MHIFRELVHIFGELVNIFGKLVHIFVWKQVSRTSKQVSRNSGPLWLLGVTMILIYARWIEEGFTVEPSRNDSGPNFH